MHSFVCINTLVSEEDGKRMVAEMKGKFSMIIPPEGLQKDHHSGGASSVENPTQIEQAIMNLITNLATGGSSRLDMVMPSISDCASDARSSPPLSIIAPLAATIKPSVAKTINVIRSQNRANRSESEDGCDADDSADEIYASRRGTEGLRQHDQNPSRPSVVHRTTSNKSMELESNYLSSSSLGGIDAPVAIKPEQGQEQQDHYLIDNLYNADPVPESSTSSSSQYLRIKQEAYPADPLNSPASSTVSSLSYEQPGGSSCSSAIIMTGNCNSSSSKRPSVLTLKRTGPVLAESECGSASCKVRRRSSRSLDDIPDVGAQLDLPSPPFEASDSTDTGELGAITGKDKEFRANVECLNNLFRLDK